MGRSYKPGSRPAAPDEPFVCGNCGRPVPVDAPGTEHRNHCPTCLWSRHVDVLPGDPRSACRALMEPVALWVRGGEWVLIHRCRECGVLKSNRVAGDDDELALMSLAVRPLADPPFPLDVLRERTERDTSRSAE